MIRPRMALQCKRCAHRPPEDSVVEALALHVQVEHDTDDIALDLVAVCDCGATMTFVETGPATGGFFDYFRCPACGLEGRVRREKTA